MVEKKIDESISKEIEPLIGETPVVVIAGKEYKMRRLGMADTFKLARVIAMGAAGLGTEISKVKMDAESVIGLLVIGFPYASDLVMELFASVLGVKVEDVKNPNLFPMGSEIEIIQALVGHIDVKAFFTKLTGLTKMPIWKEFSRKISTSSKKDTDGQTKK